MLLSVCVCVCVCLHVFSDNIYERPCTNEDLFGSFAPYFDWLYFADYRGRYEWTNGEELDFWYVEVSRWPQVTPLHNTSEVA